MLKVEIPGVEMWDEQKEEFTSIQKSVLYLEHSLISVSKWESKFKKSFLSSKEFSREETLEYVRCMTLNNVKEEVYERITDDILKNIFDYIQDPMTASSVRDNKKGSSRETITSELIYYWMISLNIPKECEKWHLNRLLMLVRICNFKNTPPKKRSKRDIMSSNAALNAARRQNLNSMG